MSKYSRWTESLIQFKRSTAETTFKGLDIEIVPGSVAVEGVTIRRVAPNNKQHIDLTRQEAEFVAASINSIYKEETPK